MEGILHETTYNASHISTDMTRVCGCGFWATDAQIRVKGSKGRFDLRVTPAQSGAHGLYPGVDGLFGVDFAQIGCAYPRIVRQIGADAVKGHQTAFHDIAALADLQGQVGVLLDQ